MAGANMVFRFFAGALGGEAAQAQDGGQPAAERGGGVGGPAVAGLFSANGLDIGQLLSIFSGQAMNGDAVYSQEALDRIIASLWEATPQSNGAPPATEEGLANLQRKVIDEDLRSEDGNTDCSICIDVMRVGEIQLSLPCKHMFHEECALTWLKEHNTCPVCRAPMEGASEGSQARSRPEPRATSPLESEPETGLSVEERERRMRRRTSTDLAQEMVDRQFTTASDGLWSNPTAEWNFPSSSREQTPPPARLGSPSPSRASAASSAQVAAGGSSRPPNQGQTRLNEAMRYISWQQEERERDRSRGTTTGFSYDTSRLQRRSSHSPSSPRAALGDDERSMRERSPSQSSRRADTEGEGSVQGSDGRGGPMGWLRGRFAGDNGRG